METTHPTTPTPSPTQVGSLTTGRHRPSFESGPLRWRLLTGEDRDAVEALLEGLSERSRALRFAGPMPGVPPHVLRHLCDVDGARHVAWGVFEGDRLVAMGRYVRFRHDPEVADLAITVADDRQGGGLGTAMLALLVDRAAAAGLSRLSFTVLGDNRPAQRLLRRVGVTPRYSAGLGEAEISVAELSARLSRRSGVEPIAA